MKIIPNGISKTHFYFSEENNQFEKKKPHGKFQFINGVDIIVDGSGSMGTKTVKWREYYYKLSQILGDDTQVMASAIEGVLVYDTFRDDHIYTLDVISGGEGYEFAIANTKHRVVIIIGDGMINDRLPKCDNKFVIYWNVDTNKNNTEEPAWADFCITNKVGGVNTQLKVLSAAAKSAQALINNRWNKTF